MTSAELPAGMPVGAATSLELRGAVPRGTEPEPPAVGATTAELEAPIGTPVALSVGVTGHTVVDTAMTEVTTVVDSAGQLVTSGAQLVTVTN